MPATACWQGWTCTNTPAPGVDLALGVRQSAVSYTQGESGNQLTAGLNLTVGMGPPPQPSWMQNTL